MNPVVRPREKAAEDGDAPEWRQKMHIGSPIGRKPDQAVEDGCAWG